MKPRLSRPLLAVAVSAALISGSAFFASPALADDSREAVTDARSVLGDATDPTEPGQPTEPTVPGAPTEPTVPGQPTEPGAPTEPTVPGQPTEPTVPGQPTEPGAPTEPTEPGTPSTPVEPGQPAEPGTPGQPAEPVTPPKPAEPGTPADTTAPTGSFTLKSAALWIGQEVVLTPKGIADDVSSPTDISRIVNWGDGTSSTLAANESPVRKRYTKVGRFTVTLTLTDAAGNAAQAVSPAVTVTSPGKFKMSKNHLWSGERFNVSITGVPAGTQKIHLHWGDGSTSWNLKGRNQTLTTVYSRNTNGGVVKGLVTLTATFVNANGESARVYVGWAKVKPDNWKPVVKVKKPGAANRLKSWKTVRGTATDKGSGVSFVFVWASRITGSKVYCYTPKKTWKRAYTQKQFNACAPVAVKAVKGKWSLKLKGLKKGNVYVDAIAVDWTLKTSKMSSVKGKITRN